MTINRTYVIGLVVVTALVSGMVVLAPAAIRAQVVWGAVVGLVLQAPLGWWAVRSIGTDRFVVVWGLGLLARFMAIAVAGFAVLPLLGISPGPTLGTMVIVLVTLLLIEGITAWQAQWGDGSR